MRKFQIFSQNKKKNLSLITFNEIGHWFQFPIPIPGFGCPLNSLGWPPINKETVKQSILSRLDMNHFINLEVWVMMAQAQSQH